MGSLRTNGVTIESINAAINDGHSKTFVPSGNKLSVYLERAHKLGDRLRSFMHDMAHGHVSVGSSKSLVHDIRALGLPGNYQDVPEALNGLNKFVMVLGNFETSAYSNTLTGFNLLEDSLNARSSLHNIHAVMSRADDVFKNSLEMRDQIIVAEVVQEVRRANTALKDTARSLVKGGYRDRRGVRDRQTLGKSGPRRSNLGLLGDNSDLSGGSGGSNKDDGAYKASYDDWGKDKSSNLRHILGEDNNNQGNALDYIDIYISSIFSSYQAIITQFGDLSHDPVGAVYAFNMGIALQVGGDAIDYLNSLSNIQAQIINPLAASLVSMVSAIAQAFTKTWTHLQTDVATTGSEVPSLTNLPFIMNNSALLGMLFGMGAIGLSPYVAGLSNGSIAPGTVLQFLTANPGQSVLADCTFTGGSDQNATGYMLQQLDGVIMAILKNSQLLLSFGTGPDSVGLATTPPFYDAGTNTIDLFNAWGLNNPCPSSSPLTATNAMLTAIGFPYLLEDQDGHPQLVIATSLFSGNGTLFPLPANPGQNPSSALVLALDQYCSAAGLGSPLTCWEALQSMASVDLSDLYTLDPAQWTAADLTNYSITNLAYCGVASTGTNFRVVFIDSSLHYKNPPANAIAIPHNLFALINSANITNMDFYPTNFTPPASATTWPYAKYASIDSGGPIAYLNINDMIGLCSTALSLIGTFVDVSGSMTLFGAQGIFANVATLQSQSQGSVQQLGNNVTQAPNQAQSVASDIVQEMQTFRDQLNTLLQSIISGGVI